MHLQVPEMHRHLLEKPYRDKLQAALEEHFKRRVRVEFSLGQPTGQTPAELEDRARQVRQEAAVQAIDKDPFVRELVENFDARVVDESIRPLGPDDETDGGRIGTPIGTGDASPVKHAPVKHAPVKHSWRTSRCTRCDLPRHAW